MSELDQLNKRIEWLGGRSGDRAIKGKDWTLKKVLRTDPYQSQTIALETDGVRNVFNREFKALINPNKLVNDYDQKILSIPYKDICLSEPKVGKTLEGEVPTGIKSGQVFYWKDTDSYWIIYLHRKTEKAYFLADIRQCKRQVDLGGSLYWCYIRGPEETTIPWNYKGGVSWNDMNYSNIIYITKNEETLAYLHRFNTVKINGNKWLVKDVDTISGDGIIEVVLGEEQNNPIEDKSLEITKQEEKKIEDARTDKKENELPYISGPIVVRGFDQVKYEINNSCGGHWKITNNKAKVVNIDNTFVIVEITSGKAGVFNIQYIVDDVVAAELPVTIKSL